jgi:prepilin-type N-terminal cleavage/methylation domain-containing protein
MNVNQKQHGFTLVELLLAMAFFSFILLFVTTGFIMVNRAYNKGLTVKLVQDEGRRTMETLTREIRSTSSEGISTAADCAELNGNIYIWSERIDGSTDPKKPYRLQKIEGTTCSNRSGTAVDMLNDRIGVQSLSITEPDANGLVYIDLVLSTSDTDLLDSNTGSSTACELGNGEQYCDVVHMETIVSPRGS